MCGGGSTSTNEFKPPDSTAQPWKDYIANAGTLASGGLTPYGGQTVAEQSPQTNLGLQMATNYATQGTPERTAAGQALVSQLTGGATNPYIGDNPYLQSMIQRSNQLISDQYQKGTAAQTDAAFGRSGTYGGSAYNDRVSQNQQQLQGALAANTNSLLGQNYNQSAQLAESGLGRQLQAAQVAQGQQGLDAAAIQQLLAAGQIPEQYAQKLLGAAQSYYTQGQQAPFTLSDYLGSALSRASGVAGSNTQVGPGASPITGLLGGGAALYSLLGG